MNHFWFGPTEISLLFFLESFERRHNHLLVSCQLLFIPGSRLFLPFSQASVITFLFRLLQRLFNSRWRSTQIPGYLSRLRRCQAFGLHLQIMELLVVLLACCLASPLRRHRTLPLLFSAPSFLRFLAFSP